MIPAAARPPSIIIAIAIVSSGLLIDSSCSAAPSTAGVSIYMALSSVVPRQSGATTTAEVCGWNDVTYPTAEVARSDATSGGIKHCGVCGACSTRQDVNIYNITRDTLTSTATKCAVVALFLGDGPAQNCMRKHVGFTAACEQCWISNIRCTIRRCAMTCLSNWALGGGGGRHQHLFVGTQLSEARLNACLACDERECGPAFKQCAGANRRRVGIYTDIERSTEEMCKTVDPAPHA